MSDIANSPVLTPRNSPVGDIVIIGAGLAGLFTALKLAPLPVTVIAAAPLGKGASSAWAQGGIAAAVGEGDSAGAHCFDTIKAGAGIVDETIAALTAHEAPERIADLLRYGVPFDRDLAGHYLLSREAAHSAKRIVRVAGDGAGRAIMQALIASVRAAPSIRVLEGYEAHDLTLDDRGAVNGVCLTANQACKGRAPPPGVDKRFHLAAHSVVLATGGIGYLYGVTTNPPYARGDALAMAARAGATIADAEFVQFHPTAIDAGIDPAPLATEALRGEGAILINNEGERFMLKQHEDAELGPRDIVARGVFREIQAGRGAFLDCRDAIGAAFPDHYPTVYQRCKDANIDPVTQPIPVAPAEHYHMGGIATDAHGRASIKGLWACGEVTSTGLHGANRLASNSLLEAVVFGARVAEDIEKTFTVQTTPRAELTPLADATRLPADQRTDAIAQLRRAMQDHVGVERSDEGLRTALAAIVRIDAMAGDDIELVNMTLAARFITVAALLRNESRGGHYRVDHPEPDPAQASRSFMTLGQLNAATS